MSVTIWWIRRDQRVQDNAALDFSNKLGIVIPVFILDDYLLKMPAENRQSFLFEGLHWLDHNLQERGSRLIIRRGEPLRELSRLVAETGAELICAEEDYSPYARKRDALVNKHLPLKLLPGLTFHHPLDILKPDGSPYIVFTPYKNAWMAMPNTTNSTSRKEVIWHRLTGVVSENIPDSVKNHLFPAGEVEANFRLDRFLREKVENYGVSRDLMAEDGTSMLSPYFKSGMISPARVITTVYNAINSASNPAGREGAQSWLNELIWREFYFSVLYHFPNVLKGAFRIHLQNIPWNSAGEEFNAWKEGKTGFPIVDAGMRQLAHTGWMHNRARMITSSFLVKDLLINWQLGEKWFMETLLDGDSASNNGGWQWIAGTGTDAAPYFRIFNPILQGKKFDPDGNYIREWIPELSQVPVEFIHTPWKMSDELQKQAGCHVGTDYPQPIVDHAEARDRALRAYHIMKSNY